MIEMGDVLTDGLTGGHLYAILFILSLLTTYSILVYEGINRTLSSYRWFTFIALCFFAIVIGSKLITVSGTDLFAAISMGKLPYTDGRMLIGGLLSLMVMVLVTGKLLQIRFQDLDAFAYALPAGIAVQRLGCFFAGCCFGRPTWLPWGVTYTYGSPTHQHHYNEWYIITTEQASLPVHPLPLYEAIGCLLILFLIYRYRRHIKSGGSLALLSLLLFAGLRMVLLGLREHGTAPFGSEQLLLFQTEQWILLILIAAAVTILIKREYSPIEDLRSGRPAGRLNQFLLTMVPAIASVGTLIFVLGNAQWFTYIEFIILSCMLLTACAVVIIGVLNFLTGHNSGLKYSGLCMAAMFICAQIPDQEEQETGGILTYHTVRFGGGFGDFSTSDSWAAGTNFCGGTSYDYRTYKHKYRSITTGYAYNLVSLNSDRKRRLGVDIAYGILEERDLGSTNFPGMSESISHRMSYIVPYYSDAGYAYSYGAGLYLGNVYFIRGDREVNNEWDSRQVYKSAVFPMAHLSFGVQHKYYFRAGLGESFPASLPGHFYYIGIGTGFWQKDTADLRFDLTNVSSQLGFKLATSKYTSLESRIALFRKNEENDQRHLEFSIGVQYNFGHMQRGVD